MDLEGKDRPNRKLVEMAIEGEPEDEPKFRRFLCSECMWSMDADLPGAALVKEAFDKHDCEDYRRRTSYT